MPPRVARTRESLGLNAVFYSIGGTASNGVDYQMISNSVTIGRWSDRASITIKPIADGLVEGTETVVLTLIASPVVGPAPYLIGSPSNAVAFIADNGSAGTNQPPEVKIDDPRDGDRFDAPANITICANAKDDDGFVVSVEFFAGTNSLGVVTNGNRDNFCLLFSNVPPGNFTLIALATDNQGATATSDPVNITVTPFVTQTNPPVVTLRAKDAVASEGTNFLSWQCTVSTNNTWQWGSDSQHTSRWDSRSQTNNTATNTATFIVRRSDGSTNSDLTVFYAISGTASNGVDYQALSGNVTIPAGQRSTPIVIVPIDDSLPEDTETVILTLLADPFASTNTPRAYLLGRDVTAEAVIVDNDSPRPPTRRLRDHSFHLRMMGTNGFCYRVEVTTNWVNWTPVCTNVVTEGAIHFADPSARARDYQFYRVRPEAQPPPD